MSFKKFATVAGCGSFNSGAFELYKHGESVYAAAQSKVAEISIPLGKPWVQRETLSPMPM